MLDNPAQGSHLRALMECLVTTTGPVLEVGAGEWSTPILRAYCLAEGRHFESLESDAEWAARFGSIHDPNHERLRTDAKLNWDVVLIDHAPAERRAPDALLFLSTARYVVIHDYQEEGIRQDVDAIAPHWNTRRVYQNGPVWTVVLSAARTA